VPAHAARAEFCSKCWWSQRPCVHHQPKRCEGRSQQSPLRGQIRGREWAEQSVTRCAASAEDSLCPGRDCSSCQMLMPPHVREKRVRCWQLPPPRRGEDQGLCLAGEGACGSLPASRLWRRTKAKSSLGNIPSLISGGRLIAGEVSMAEHTARRCAPESEEGSGGEGRAPPAPSPPRSRHAACTGRSTVWMCF